MVKIFRYVVVVGIILVNGVNFILLNIRVINILRLKNRSRKNPLHRNRLWQICQVKKFGRFTIRDKGDPKTYAFYVNKQKKIVLILC